MRLQPGEMSDRAAQRIGSPAAGFGETRLSKITSSAKLPLHTLAEGGQVEPVLGSPKENMKMLGACDKYPEMDALLLRPNTNLLLGPGFGGRSSSTLWNSYLKMKDKEG